MSTIPPPGAPPGAWPVMPTPFAEDMTPDLAAVEPLVDFYLRSGVAGIFTCALSSEVFQLLPSERHTLARQVVHAVDGRVPVIAAAVGPATPQGWADEVRRVQDTGVDAVVLITSLLADRSETAWAWQERMEAVLAATDGDLGLYECPVPYKRLLPDQQLAWAAQTDRFVYFKDTTHSVPEMRSRIAATAGTRMSMYNAEMQSLVDTVRAGGHGFSGLAANIYPGLVGWLCEHAYDATPQVRRVQRLLSVAEHAIGPSYPSSAKLLLARRWKVPISGRSRMSPTPVTAHQIDPVLDLWDLLADEGLLELAPATEAVMA